MKKIIFTIVVLLILHLTFNIDNCMCQWQPDVRLTQYPGESNTSLNNAWCVAANGNVVHVVWSDERDGDFEIYYKRSTDAGVSWGADTRLTYASYGSWSPSIAVSGSVVHVVWQDNRDSYGYYIMLYYKRSTDSGLTWGADIRLTMDKSEYPSISVSGSFVHIVWIKFLGFNSEIYYKRSTDGGITWGDDTRLTINSADSFYPSIAVSGTLVHVVWRDNRDGNYEIYYKRSTDFGLTWGLDTRLTNNTATSNHPSIAVSGSFVNVVWEDERDGINNTEIYFKRSTDAGVSWGTDIRLTNNIRNSRFPSIAVSGSLFHTVWIDDRDYSNEIYYKRSTNAGVIWETDTRLTFKTPNSFSYYPSITVSGSVIHTVWYDTRDGNREIYYKRNPTGNVGIKNISTEIPSAYSLEQNYPNPFNPITKIKFDIPSGFPIGTFGNDNVVLKVFDITGKEIATLVNESALGGHPGTYEVTFDASMLTSGIYFYRLSAGDFSETKKMLMIK